MARIASCSFDHHWLAPGPEATAAAQLAQGPGRINGKAFTLQRMTTLVVPGVVNWTSNFVTALAGSGPRTIYGRIYIRLRAIPGAGGLRFLSVHGTSENIDDAFYLIVNSSGGIELYSKGNGARVLICTLVRPGGAAYALTLNTWYCLQFLAVLNTPDTRVDLIAPPGDDATVAHEGSLSVWISQAGIAASAILATNPTGDTGTGRAGTYPDPSGPPAATGLDHTTEVFDRITIGVPNFAQVETDGGILDLDDLSVDDATLPRAGQVTTIVPNGNGFYQQFATSDWRHVAQQPPSAKTATPGAVQSALTSINTVSFALQSLESLGVTGAIKAYLVGIYGQPARNNWRLLLRKNGTDYTSPLQTGGSNAWQGVPTAMIGGAGWYLPSYVVGGDGAPGDVHEVGFVDGNTGAAGTTAISAAMLMIDHESIDPAALVVTPSADLQIYFGRYTGNGTVQDVALPFKPTFLMIKPDGQSGAVWADGFAPNGAFGNKTDGQAANQHGISRVYANGFTVWDSVQTGVNVSSNPTRYIAISDPARRMMQPGIVAPNPTNAAGEDNFNVSLTDPTFAIEALWSWGQFTSGAGTSRCFYRGPGHIGLGDLSTVIDTNIADIADAIQSIGVGTFQLGRQAATTSVKQAAWIAMRTAGVFNGATALCQIGTYTGDGVASRTIPFATALVGPGLVIVFPPDSKERTYRWADDLSTDSWNYLVGTARTGVASKLTGFTAAGFTIATGGLGNLNAAGVKFNYIAFAGAPIVTGPPTATVDPGEAPVTALSTIGLTWVELLDPLNVLHVWSKIALPDPASYYGGYKEDRVTKWGQIQRALSDRNGVYEGADFPWTCSDTDRTLRALLANASTQYLLTRPITVRMISDADRRLLKTPITAFKGTIREYKPTAELTFEWTAQDVFADKFNSQASADQIPQRLITAADFPAAILKPDPDFPNVPVTIGLPVPIIYGEITDTQPVLGLVATTNLLVQDKTIPAPVLESLQRVTGVISDASVNVFVAITAIKAGKEGPFSNVKVLKASAGGVPTSYGVRVNWNAIPDVDSYRIYFADTRDCVPYKTNGTATRILYMTHDNVTVDGANPPSYQVTLSDPSAGGVVDLLGGSAPALIDAGNGQTPLIYVGAYALPDSANSGTSTIAVAPTPAISGVSFDVVPVTTLTLPATPFYVHVWPAATSPTPANTETIQITGVAGATLTGIRAQLGTTARTIIVGDQIMVGNPGALWRKFVVCGHAVKQITEVYSENKPVGLQDAGYWPAALTTPASFGFPNWVDLIVPGTQSWVAMFGASAPPYEDINGNRYTVIYVKVGDINGDRAAGYGETSVADVIPGAVSVKGIESNGDSTGTLITDGILQYRHCLQNFVFGNYRSGAWLSSPVFADDGALTMIDDASFDAASAIAATRIVGGYVGAGIIGWSAFDGSSMNGSERVTVRDLIARWNLSCDVDSGFNRKGQFFVSMEQETAALLSSARAINDVSDVVENTLDIVDKFEEHFNKIPFQHTEDYFGRSEGGWRLVSSSSDAESIANNGGKTKEAPIVSLYFVRGKNTANDYLGYVAGTNTATDIIRRRLRRTKNPPRYATFQIGIQGLNVGFDLGSVIVLTHYAGIGAAGWINRPLRIVRIAIDVDAYTVELTAYDLQALYDTGFLLGDETVLPGTIGVIGSGWSSATAAQRIYGFLGDELAGTFGNGDPMKRLS